MHEIHDFTMHPNILYDIIDRQAGTLEKAVLEATMNAAEAGSPRFDIDFTVDPNRIVMTDSGVGIKTKTELEEHFKQFGTPHEAGENKKWAQFRMGRGQCFAMGRNKWLTCGWILTTDIRTDKAANRRPRFVLNKSTQEFKGCRIEIDLYDDKFHGTVESLKALVKKQVQFVDMSVYFNGEQINTPPADLKWTMEDDDAYYLFGPGHNLIIYNMGVRYQDIPASDAGAVGVIVSKAQLKVNFARNEVLSDCAIMQRINQVIRANRIKKTRKVQRRLSRDERIAALNDLRDGYQSFNDLKTVGLFYTTNDRSLTFRDVMNIRMPWTFGESGDVVCDRLIQAGQAICIDRSCMDELSYTGEHRDFFQWLTRSCDSPPDWSKIRNLYQSSVELKQGYNENMTMLPDNLLTKKEKRLLRVLNGFDCWDGRTICIGIGPAYNGWTDGSSYIAIERNFVNYCYLGSFVGAADLFGLLIHELAHTEKTYRTHIHGEEFYRAFHDIARHGIGDRSPYKYAEIFVDRMKRAIRDERVEEAVRRERKANERVEKALGVGKVAADAKQPRTQKVPRRKRRHVGRRLPAGAE